MSEERRNRILRAVIIGSVLLYMVIVLIAPLAALFFKAADAGAGAIFRSLSSADAIAGLKLSLLLVACAGVVNGIAGVAGGIVLARHRFIGRRVIDALVDLPLALSPVMIGFAFLLMFGRGGWFAPVIESANVRIVFAIPGLIIATLLVTLPFTMREVAAVLEEIGSGDEEAAATLGASPWQTFQLVTLPNIRHGLAFGLTLTCARALGEFGAVLLVGGAISGRTQTATTFIYTGLEERHDSATYGMAVLLAGLSIAVLVFLQWLKRRRVH